MESGRKRMVAVMAAVAVMVVAVTVMYDFNGGSLDFTDRETRVIPTDSMDGEKQPYVIETVPRWSLVMIELLNTQEEKDTIKLGDVVSFHNTSTGLLTVHRVTNIVLDSDGHVKMITTKGDNKSGEDTPFDVQYLKGKVVGVSVWMGAIVHFVQSSTLLLALMVVIVIVMVSVILDIVKINRRRGH